MNYKAPEKAVVIAGERYPGLNIGGKAYAPVPRRIESAHKNGGYTMIRCDWPEIFGIKCCEVEIVCVKDGTERHYIGTAEVRLEFARPISDAQTSALGRALGMAGFDIETAIASSEDMRSVLEEQGGQIVEAEPAQLPDPWEEPRRLAKERGYTPDQWKTLTTAMSTPERALLHLQNTVPSGS